jgi:uncharacterized HAD superfamily protein
MRIGLDLDEVVADGMATVVALHNKRHGTSFKVEQFNTWNLHEVWGGTEEEAIKEMNDFFLSGAMRDIDPIAGSLEAIAELKAKGHELYIITGRADSYIPATEAWLEKHFPDIFLGVHYANLFSLENQPRKKSEICKEFGIELFVDDNTSNAIDVASVCPRVFLFDQPWNRNVESPKVLPVNIERIYSWEEILRKIG